MAGTAARTNPNGIESWLSGEVFNSLILVNFRVFRGFHFPFRVEISPVPKKRPVPAGGTGRE
jgi:hypothetical protein